MANLRKTLHQSSAEVVDPDHLYVGNDDYTTIVCGNILPEPAGPLEVFLYEEECLPYTCEHGTIVDHHLKNLGYKKDDDYSIRREDLVEMCLLGRQGRYGTSEYLTFWNTDIGLYNKYLGWCLQEMKKAGIYDPQIKLSTPFGTQRHVKNVESGLEGRELSPEEKRRVELRRRMHLATGEEKKQIRKELGLWTDKPHATWQSQMYKQRFDPAIRQHYTPENIDFKGWLYTD